MEPPGIDPKIEPVVEPDINSIIEPKIECKIEPPKPVHEKLFTSEMTTVLSENGSQEDSVTELTKELKESIYDLKDEADPEDLAEMFEIPIKLV